MASKSTTVPSLSDLTVQQILDVMRPNGQVLAVGKYQAIPVTFKAWIAAQNISTNSTFNAELQEKLGDWLISGKRPKVAQYVFGSNSVSLEDAQLELAKEFASVPVPYRITRPAGAGGKGDPGRIIEAGQSYYFGIGGNRSASSSTKYQNALLEARQQGSLTPLKQFIARGEGNYDALNRGTAGDTSTYSSEYYNALSGMGTISPPTPQFTDNLGGYIARVYDAPFSGSGDYNKFLLNPRYKAYKKRLTESGINYNINSVCSNLTLLVDSDLNGDLTLIDGLNGVQVTKEQEIRSITEDKLQSFSPDAKYVLMNSKIFEMFPDSMRNKMSINSAVGGANPNYSHAWRAPGKVSVTADLTIPGISGLRVGQIFWIDRISEAYKQYGAFQLFGLTEHIDMSKGWTTSIHSRFNVLPRKSGVEYLYDSINKKDGNTTQTTKEATPTNQNVESARQAISQVRLNF